jgi:hypothetical protein
MGPGLTNEGKVPTNLEVPKGMEQKSIQVTSVMDLNMKNLHLAPSILLPVLIL